MSWCQSGPLANNKSHLRDCRHFSFPNNNNCPSVRYCRLRLQQQRNNNARHSRLSSKVTTATTTIVHPFDTVVSFCNNNGNNNAASNNNNCASVRYCRLLSPQPRQQQRSQPQQQLCIRSILSSPFATIAFFSLSSLLPRPRAPSKVKNPGVPKVTFFL